ncbi:hypothetical protein H9660_04340 [Clostridium sp. Sa3CUN1]|uniref:Uncharacterized protein n=1 Tax=Clostridium gallinarum TaxID=2762246 RepID=A0ABR8Q1S2_9CLOT|nr:hypothetical protein [Clostridium gallinarum]MBD7914366.1 hypothetical protein [Clostridium gallinarum]
MAKKKHRKRRGRAAADLFGGRRAEIIIDSSETTQEESETVMKDGATTESPNRDELLEELGIVNLSIDLVTIVVIATILNLYYVYSLKAQISDELFNTNFKENFIDTTNFPRLTNTMFLFTTGIFLILNYTLLQESKCEHRNDLNDREVISSWKSFLASLFTFLAVTISRDNLDL